MRRLAVIALGVLITAAAAGGAPSPPVFLLSGSQNAGLPDVFVTDADGGDWLSLTGGRGPAWDPAWSPDGSRVVFASNLDTGPSGAGDLYVAAPDGSSLRRLTSDAAVTGPHSVPQWSPDGSTIAYLAGGLTGLWVVPAGGGAPRRLETGTDQLRGPLWSPGGSTLVHVDWSPAGGASIVVVDAASGVPVARFKGSDPAWSPDGSRLAFVDGANRLAVAKADGTSPRELTELRSGQPAWSPDGKRLVFVATTVFTSLPETRFGYPARADVFVVPADGSGAPARLTGPFRFPPNPSGAYPPTAPGYSPDATEILYRLGSAVWRMNPDGTCARPIPGLAGLNEGPYRRPGSAAGPVLACVDLQASAAVDPGQVALGRPAQVRITVENHGDLPAHDVVVNVSPSTPTSFAACEPSCAVGSLTPGASQDVFVDVSSTVPGNAGVHWWVSSRDADSTPDDTAGTASATVLDCTLVGSWGADRLAGTPGADRICGLPGADWLSGGPGDDYLSGGSGNDTIFGGPGHDTILGGGGRDVVFARDGARDWIDCGTEYDIVVADRIDHVHRDCERVLRG